MQDYPLEFVIEYWATGESGHYTVIGRCGNTPIQVGEHFDLTIRYKPRSYPDGLGDPPEVDVVLPISLSVDCIHAYGRSLPELGPGMTGSLVLRGEAANHIPPGWVLGRKQDFSAPG